MKVYLLLSDKLLNFSLPQEVSGSYSFDENSDEESKLINIEARDNKWFLYSTDDVTILDNNIGVSDKEIVPNNFYILKRNDKNYLIFVSDVFGSKFDIYSYSNGLNIIIGGSSECNINYSVGNNKGCIAKIVFSNNNYVLCANSGGIYVNNKAIKNKEYNLKFGDVIVIYSLKIVFLNQLVLINNPLNRVNFVNNSSGLVLQIIDGESDGDNLEIKDRNLYNKDDYFSKSPRIRRIIEEKEIKLSSPPKLSEEQDMPLILTIGPMLTMAIISFVTLGNSISKIVSKETTLGQQFPSLISAGAMLLSMLLWPLVMRLYTKKYKAKKKKETIEKYNEYLNEKKIELQNEYKLQKDIILENLITSLNCVNIIQKRGYNFWDKRVDQEDFLLVRIGIGNVPLKVKIEYPEDGFTVEEDELKKQTDKVVEEFKYITDVPMGYSFLENRITAIMGGSKKSYAFIDNIILQIIAFYSYEDVKFVIFSDENNCEHWNYIKYLNHVFNNEKNFRFFATDLDSSKNVADYLSNELNYRVNAKMTYPKPHYFVITDDYEKIKNFDFVKNFTESEDNLGFSLVILENSLSKLPSKCSNFITLGVDNQCGILKNSYEKQEQIYFKEEIDYSIDMMKIAKIVSNIPIEFEGGISHLPDSISFMEMEKVGKVEQLNILNRWNCNDSTASLRAEVGVDDQNNLMYLDLHEKAHGPHGLIAGTTGSGKSEFIITYILSMCINYSPDDVSFILIDYKGGGLALAFENKVTGVVLPHLAGTITNLDKAEMDRTLVSIDSEVKRRQQMFNDARDNLGESTIDIYKYQKYYHEGRISEPIPHLFIICDEFAELKTQQPDFMDNLISVARIGRSLGVHLILATQKPSGVVNDQIWSNSKFKVCLKVQDESDSREMIKKNDAAYLKQAGRYYLQVGYDEYFALGQSGWCGAKYYPSDKIVREVDKSVNIVDDCGLFIKSIQASTGKKIEAQGEQLGAILKSIISTSERVEKVSKKLWLDNIPNVILVDDIINKYNYTFNDKNIEAIVGEYDAPEKQEQGIISFNYIKDGNTIIYGNDGSENELLLNSIVYSTVNNFSSQNVNFYAVDFGSEAMNKFAKLAHFGGIVLNGEDEKFNNLLKLIRNEIKRRKKKFVNFGGDFNNYVNSNQGVEPLMIIIFNNYDSIYESYQSLYDDLPELVRDSERYGIIFIITCNSINSVNSKVSSNFNNIYTFKLKESSDYASVLGASTKIMPREIFGRGLLNNGGIHEFQTSYIVSPDDNISDFITKFVDEKNSINSVKAKSIPVLPDILRFNDIKDFIGDLHSVPFAISKNDLEILTFDFIENVGSIIASNRLNNMEKFVKSLLYVLANVKNNILFVFDPMKLLGLNNEQFKNYYVDNFDEILDNIIKYVQSLIDSKQLVSGSIVIYGLDKFISNIKKEKIEELSKLLKSYEKISLIMIDDSGKIKSYLFESWLTSITSLNDGIWIGKGISDQNVFHLSTINKGMTIEIKNNMGYYISQGSSTLCKMIDFISKDDEDGK